MGDKNFLLTNLLSSDEEKIITSIMSHLEQGEKKIGIQQIAAENYVSTTSVMKMCKRLGFDGYSELFYELSRQVAPHRESDDNARDLKSLIDNYSDELMDSFCDLLYTSRKEKLFTTGQGFSAIVVAYIAQRLSICGFMVFNNVQFYDCMLFQTTHESAEKSVPSILFAVSQSGETEPVLRDVRQARQEGYKIVSFTRRDGSTLASLSDVTFVIDGSKQTLAGSLPNLFFGHVVLAFEELMAYYFNKLD